MRRLLRPRTGTARDAVERALAQYAIGSAANGPGQQTIAEFNARAFVRGEAGEGVRVRTMTREEVKDVCGRLEEVEGYAKEATDNVLTTRPGLPPAVFGTAVYMKVKEEIDKLNNPDFVAEKSFLKSKEGIDYGERGSIRIDVFERVQKDQSTVCVYDLKTRTRGLSIPRMTEIATTSAPSSGISSDSS
jgi:hypothetical protein